MQSYLSFFADDSIQTLLCSAASVVGRPRPFKFYACWRNDMDITWYDAIMMMMPIAIARFQQVFLPLSQACCTIDKHAAWTLLCWTIWFGTIFSANATVCARMIEIEIQSSCSLLPETSQKTQSFSQLQWLVICGTSCALEICIESQ